MFFHMVEHFRAFFIGKYKYLLWTIKVPFGFSWLNSKWLLNFPERMFSNEEMLCVFISSDKQVEEEFERLYLPPPQQRLTTHFPWQAYKNNSKNVLPLFPNDS